MPAKEPQSAPAILMIRPIRFSANPQTAASNAFQKLAGDGAAQDTQARALREFDDLVAALRGQGVEVHVFEDTPEPHTPDSIFPNNWLTTHPDGTVVMYPMQAENRRPERRPDIVRDLVDKAGFRVSEILDLASTEADHRFLEGTGSMVLDRANRVVYACVSPRTDRELLASWAERFGYQPIIFTAVDGGGQQIYHTNVMMCVGQHFAVVCSASIPDAAERRKVLSTLASTGHDVVEITPAQMNAFAGNMLEVLGVDGGSVVAMSSRAADALTRDQREVLERHATIVSSDITTIEDCAGGSVRCMMAEIFLPRVEA
jgi:hypothetical protein